MEPANGCLPVRCPASLPHHPGQPEPRFSDVTQPPARGSGPPPSLPIFCLPSKGRKLNDDSTPLASCWDQPARVWIVCSGDFNSLEILLPLERAWGWGERQQSFLFPPGV